ncbi:MAG: hypothetical protein Q8Q59_05965 [Luteolibacter sp.]|jgi:hypothetical protein|nr:hypothetical protein [Luteolibacter sp.]
MNHLIAIFLLLFGVAYSAEKSRLITMKPTSEIERAELYVWKPEGKLKAVFVFCPRHNGSGESFVNNKEWRTFSAQNQIALVGLSFASPVRLTKQAAISNNPGQISSLPQVLNLAGSQATLTESHIFKLPARQSGSQRTLAENSLS